MIEIRTTWTARDVPRLYAIEAKCFEQEFRWSKVVFVADLKAGDIWIAEENDEILGFILMSTEKGQGYVDTVDVHPKARGRGIASLLMDAAEAEFKKRGCREIRLDVHVDNPAQILYFKRGYRVTTVKRHHYHLHSHAIRMIKAFE